MKDPFRRRQGGGRTSTVMRKASLSPISNPEWLSRGVRNIGLLDDKEEPSRTKNLRAIAKAAGTRDTHNNGG